MREDPHLEILLPCAAVLLALGEEKEKQGLKMELQLLQTMVAQRTFDEQLRVRWFKGPLGAELSALAGPFEIQPPADTPQANRGAASVSLSDNDGRLLRLLVGGRSNNEIAQELGLDEAEVTRELAALYARIGTATRAEATAFAFRTGAI